MHVHELLQEKFPVRNSDEQKNKFLQFMLEWAAEKGYAASVEKNGKKGENQNLVIGNPETAKMVVVGHYDTPRTMFLPNLMMPKRILLMVLYGLLVALPFLLLGILAQILVVRWTGNDNLSMLAFMLVYLSTFYVCLFKGPVNQHNANDNTSGIATMMRIMETLPDAMRDQVAFIFFDNEEKGKWGSKAYAKAHPTVKKEKMVINLDCVALGNHFITVANKKMLDHAMYQLFKETAPEDERYQVQYHHNRNALLSSDQSAFDRGIGIAACKKVPVIGYAAGRIHTRRDTVADTENMDYLAMWMNRLAEKL